jgi:capsular polysaccharide biosynthesis protein
MEHAEQLSMVEQIKVTASSKVLVVMKGGASLLSLFLPRGATAILLHRGKGNFDNAVYDNIPYFHVWSEPVLNNVTSKMTENVYNLESICHQVLQGIERYDDSAY